MKRLFWFLIGLAMIAGLWWMSQNQDRRRVDIPQLKQLDAVARNASRIAARELTARAVEAQKQLEAEMKPQAPQLSKWEKLLCELANEERRKRGLSALEIDPRLATVARGHSTEMMQKGYFSHTSPTAARRTVSHRYKLVFHSTPSLVAENIYTMRSRGLYQLSEKDIRRAHEGWMKSPGHRANILRTSPLNPRRIGVGIAVKGGSFWATQNFASP